MQPTLLDLFSGIGGFSLAFEREGFKTIGFSEIDPYASAVLKKHWPDVPNYGDIRTIRNVRADVVTGGFPCQPFSLAGKRKGKADDRFLWPEMCRVIAESGADWVLAENVPGIIGMELDRVLSDLENISYTPWPLVIPACAVGAYHKRNRVFVIANSGRQRLENVQKRRPAAGSVKRSGRKHSDVDTMPMLREFLLYDPSETFSRMRMPSDRGNGLRSVYATSAWLQFESGICGVAHGIPARVDRLKCPGNAIVPQVAQVFAKAIRQFYP